MAHQALRMSGRCRNGFEADAGSLFHAVRVVSTSDGRQYVGSWDRAVCGAAPGRKGNGWSDDPGATVTCSRCLAKLARAA